jgi:hypothetical protein
MPRITSAGCQFRQSSNYLVHTEVNVLAKGRQEITEYATREDFCRIFAADMNRLFLLALLLTGDIELA